MPRCGETSCRAVVLLLFACRAWQVWVSKGSNEHVAVLFQLRGHAHTTFQ